MCSIESIGHSSNSTSNKLLNRKISLNMIEKRLKHLREELKNLTQRDIAYTTSNLLTEQQTSDNNDEHHVQYKKRLNQLLRLHDKQVNTLNLWHFYRSNTIEHMYAYELRQSDETFQLKKNDFKSKLLSTYHDKRRYLDFEYQNVNIRCRHLSNNDQFILNKTNNTNDIILFDGYNHHSNESTQQQQQQPQRPTYNLRRAVVNDSISENSSTTSTSLKDLSIFSRSNSLLPPFGGIELQRRLSNIDIEQDIKDVQNGLCHDECITEKETSKTKIDDLSTKSLIDVRIEEGRLWYQRAWFSRNSPILLVFDDLEIVPALVLTVGRNDLLIRRSGTNIKHRVSLSLLYDGHLAIRKRNCIF
ncbi:unnamed protein product [Rotaria sordida]|uniref:Uncharacterized protein n=1 Tax=Rotaria sordida TaxID=392033 RepID=A0A818JRA3_9BILA|nr:unnamed protein product [Rotaria sordida]CAF1050088.1 unnamed protein product [Rotaria sordida]CAF1120245.1 unnamed protein product [Rotaria sordida]CAF3545283.1 unnamed protein product [Rotaria sordida]CAF3552733.1 unnamed protein product [Rotaria sordida]